MPHFPPAQRIQALLLLLPLLYLLPVNALTQPYNLSEISPHMLPRQLSISTTSPTTRALRASPLLQTRVLPAYPLCATLTAIIEARRARSDPLACNLRRVNWVVSSLHSVRIRQIGEYVDDCQSRLNLNDAVASPELDAAFGSRVKPLIADVNAAIFEAQRRIDAIPDDNNPALNWTRGVFSGSDRELQRAGQTCRVETAFAYRISGEWYLKAGVTNAPVDAFMPPWQRQAVYEYIPKEGDKSLTLPWIKFGTEGEVVPDTTFLSRWSGKPSLSHVGSMKFDEKPALMAALRMNDVAVDQAEDALPSSNISILALPMAMSFIPVTFLADLNTCATLWYIILTDVFSALPFFIKGVELLDSVTIKRSETVAYYLGNHTLSQMEIWAAECRGRDSFRVRGIVFISVAVLGMALGVGLEVFAMVFMHRRPLEKGKQAVGPFGMAIFDATAFSALGSAREDERERRVRAEMAMHERGDYEAGQWLDQGFNRPGALGDDGEYNESSYSAMEDVEQWQEDRSTSWWLWPFLWRRDRGLLIWALRRDMMNNTENRSSQGHSAVRKSSSSESSYGTAAQNVATKGQTDFPA